MGRAWRGHHDHGGTATGHGPRPRHSPTTRADHPATPAMPPTMCIPGSPGGDAATLPPRAPHSPMPPAPRLPPAPAAHLAGLASAACGDFRIPEGLESAGKTPAVASEAAVAEWLLDQLHITQARGDGVNCQAVGAWRRNIPRVTALNHWVHTREPASCACKPSRWAAAWLTGCATSTG